MRAMTEGDGAATLSDSGALSFADLDSNDVVTVSQSSNSDIAWSGGALARRWRRRWWPASASTRTAGTTAPAQNLDFLARGETITFSFDVVATDDCGAGNAASAPHDGDDHHHRHQRPADADDRRTTPGADRGRRQRATLSDSGALSFADLDGTTW